MNKRQRKKIARIENEWHYKIKCRPRYGNKELLYHYECPTCGWDSTNDDELINGYMSDIWYDYEGNKQWVSNYKCPYCNTEFSYSDGV